MEITDRIAVVTGAGSGIGRSFAKRLIDRGARHVVCTDLNGENAAETAEMIGDKASARALDVSDEGAIEALVRDVEAEIGGIDIFVSNAGYGQRGGLDLATEDWEKMIEGMVDVVHRGNQGFRGNGTAWAYIGRDISVDHAE